MAPETMPDDLLVLPPRQDISAAWLGRDLAKHPEIWTVTLSPDQEAVGSNHPVHNTFTALP